MSNATQSLAGTRITSLLDANSFVEIGQGVTARSTDFRNGYASDGNALYRQPLQSCCQLLSREK